MFVAFEAWVILPWPQRGKKKFKSLSHPQIPKTLNFPWVSHSSNRETNNYQHRLISFFLFFLVKEEICYDEERNITQGLK